MIEYEREEWILYKRIVVYMTATVIVMIGLAFSQTDQVHAEDIDQEIKELKEKSKKASDKRSSLSSELSELEKQIEENKSEQGEMKNEINSLKDEITDAQKKIEEKQNEVNQKQGEIEEVESEIAALENKIKELEQRIEELKQNIKETQEKIKNREGLLEDRLRNLQRNGGSVKYLEVVLGASDFGDFLNRSQAVSKIMDQDKSILKEHLNDKISLEEDKKELEDSRAQVEANKDELSNQRQHLENEKQSLVADMQELQGLENNLNDKLSEQNNLLANLQQKEQELQEYTMSVEEEQANLAAQERAFDQLIAELEEQKKQEQNNSVEQTSVVSNDYGFTRPTSGTLTSTFGPRWGSFHYGIDIAKPGPGVAVNSVASGVVSRSYHSSSYGNVVFIVHMVNGQKYTSVYAHLRDRFVSEGEQVKQGQVIGHQGNTGRSHGQHLHFELHKGNWNGNKSNAVDPVSYGIQ